jgi:hypothetical protein
MSKPKFDPSQEFSVADSKPRFDPSKKFEEVKPSSQAQAALEGFGQGATLGYLPQLQAGLEMGINKLRDGKDFVAHKMGLHGMESVDAQLRDKGITLPEESYTQIRDQNIARNERLAAENPLTYGGAGLAGAIASTAVPGTLAGKLGLLTKAGSTGKALVTAEKAAELSKLAKVAGVGKRIAQGAATGASFGLVANPGDVAGEINPLQLDKRVANAKTGALTGAIAQGGIETVGGLARGAANTAKGIAETKAFKATGAMLKDFRKADKTKSVKAIGRQLLDDKVVTAGATPKKVVERLETLIDDSTKTIENAIKQIDEGSAQAGSLKGDQAAKLQASFFRPKEVADRLKTEIREKYSQIPKEKLQAAMDEIDSWFGSLPETLPISQVHAMKKQMGKFLKESDFYKRGADLGLAKEGTLAVRRGLKEGVEKQADTVSEMLGGAGGEIKTANKRLGNYITVKDVATDRVNRDAGNRAFGLTDNIWGAAGMTGAGGVGGGLLSGDLEGAAKGAIGAGALMGASKLGRTYGNSVMAVGFDKVASSLMRVPQMAELAQKNPTAFQALVNRVMIGQENQTDQTGAMQRRMNEK